MLSPMRNRLLLMLMFALMFLSTICLGASIIDFITGDWLHMSFNLAIVFPSITAVIFIYLYLYKD